MDVHFKTITYLKKNWLKNITNSGGAQNEVIKNKASTDLVVHCHKDLGRLWCSMNEDELLERTQKNHGLYEVISDFPHKVYFDIDKKEKTDETYLNKIIDKINELFPDSNMAISGSVTNDMTSYHIILNHYFIDSEQDRKQMKYIAKYLKIYFDDGFDWKVYTKNRNMKCINQSKQDKRIQRIILNDDPKMHLITCFMDDDYYPIPQFEKAKTESMKHIKLKIEVDKSLEPLNLGLLPKLDIKLPKDLDLNNMSNLNLLSIIPLNKSFDHSYTHRIARFCFYNNLTLENFLSWYKQKSTDEDKIKKWQSKWEELKNFPPMSIPAITSILLKYYPDLNREKGYQKFISLFTLDKKNIHKVPTLSQECLNKDDKFICLNTGMGSGKTYQAIEYLKNVDSFIWMAPIEALAQNTMYRLEQNKIDCKYYKDFKNSAEKLEKLSKYDKMIICINSLRYTNEKVYKVVVIDEIETLLNKWFNNETLKNNKLETWNRFLDIIKKADKVILLDAFTSKLTTDFINCFENNKHSIYELIKEPITRDIQELHNMSQWVREIIDCLKQNKKVFIFYPYLRRHRNFPSMEEFKLKLEEKTNKKGICYNSQVDDKILKGLKNVNETWSNNCDFVITNTKITVGINYEINDFHQVFLSAAGFNVARDLTQVSYRCRKLIDNIIKVVYIENYNHSNTFENDNHLVKDCPIYQNIVKNILIERQAPLKQSFNFLCDKAHYNIIASPKKVNEELDKYFKTLFEDANLYYGYSDIPDIDDRRLAGLETKLCLQTATTEDKAMIKKYYYKNQFKNIDEEELEFGWDERFTYFFEKLSVLIHDENNIYKKISEFNSWDSIFPSDKELNKVKLNEELLDRIFKEYHFKDLKKTSTAKSIIKHIYNAFFNKHVIKSKTKDKKNYSLYIDEDVHRVYNYGIENLKRYQKYSIFDRWIEDILNGDDIIQDKNDLLY